MCHREKQSKENNEIIDSVHDIDTIERRCNSKSGSKYKRTGRLTCNSEGT